MTAYSYHGDGAGRRCLECGTVHVYAGVPIGATECAFCGESMGGPETN